MSVGCDGDPCAARWTGKLGSTCRSATGSTSRISPVAMLGRIRIPPGAQRGCRYGSAVVPYAANQPAGRVEDPCLGEAGSCRAADRQHSVLVVVQFVHKVEVGDGKVPQKGTSDGVDPNHSVLESAREHLPIRTPRKWFPYERHTRDREAAERRSVGHGEHLDLGRLAVVRGGADRNLLPVSG